MPEVPEELRQKLCLALDVDDLVAANRLARDLKGHFGVVKVGLELFTAVGPDVIGTMTDHGYRVFVDLKLLADVLRIDAERLDSFFAKLRAPATIQPRPVMVALTRLLEEQVRDDDWYPCSPEMQELDAWDTVGQRRRWFRELQRERKLAR